MWQTIRAGIAGTLLNPQQWYPMSDRKVFPSPWFLPVMQGAFIASTMLPRRARIKYATPVLLLMAVQARLFSSGDAEMDFARGTLLLGMFLKFIDFGILVKEGEVYKLKDKRGLDDQSQASNNLKQSPVGMAAPNDAGGVWQSVKSSVELWFFTMRGIGWNWEVGGILEREPQSAK